MAKKVKFNGCSDTQANWGRGADPRLHLKKEQEYELDRTEVHSWHTLYYLKGITEGFNSVCFSDV